MFTAIPLSQIYVLDQNEALDFYVGKLGLEVKNDIDMGFMRWLTVGVPGEPGRDGVQLRARLRDVCSTLVPGMP